MCNLWQEIHTMAFRSVATIFRWGLFLFTLVLTLCWMVAGHRLAQQAGGTATVSPEEAAKKITKKLEAENPQAAAELTRIRENGEIRAVAAVLYEADARGGVSAVQGVVDRKVKCGRTPPEIRLASLAIDPNLLPNAASRDEFLWTHASTLQLLDHDETGVASNAYLDRLEQASHTPESWRVARSNAMAMLVHECVPSPQLREFYEQEQEWLDATIVEVTTRVDMSDSEKRSLVSDVVKVAYDNRPYFKQAVTEQNLDAGGFFLFAQYGDVIRRMAGAGAVPLGETLEVIFANGDFLERFKTDSPEQLAARLVCVRSNKPAVWQASRKTPFALRLNEDAPQVADKLFEKHAADDIAVLLYAGYENEVLFAAEAVDKFGDLAILILNRYAGSPRFHAALKQNFGPRLIPYIEKFGDQGLDRVKDNQAWLDKYFERDGTPKEEEWWTQLPGGAAPNIARNWAKGYPNEWSELGWAALDVADAALAVASFGTSEAVTETVKEGTKIAVKDAAKAGARTEAKKAILRAGQRRASRELTADGARAAAKKESQSLLRRAIAQGAKFGRVVKGPAGKVWHVVAATGHTVKLPAEKVLEAAKKFHDAWHTVPAAYRKIVYRSLLAVGLFVTISERTIPALGKIGDAAGKFVGDLVKNTGNALAEGLKSGIEKALGLDRGEANRWVSWLVYLTVLVLLGATSWKLCPIGKGRLRYV
jgi:hypothetical protein